MQKTYTEYTVKPLIRNTLNKNKLYVNGFVCDFIDLVSLTLYMKVSNAHTQKLIYVVKSYIMFCLFDVVML